MRTQQSNPAYRQFSHLLPKSGRYPAKWVDVFWNRDVNSKIIDVEVVYIPRQHDAPGNDQRDSEFWSEFSNYNDQWMSDLGNSMSNWLEPDGDTPASIFGFMLKAGFASDTQLQQALEEFAHIEECDWAREMLKGFDIL